MASFPSSYIPTTTAAVTRAADSLTITGVTGLGSTVTLYARAMFVGADSADTPNNRVIIELNNGTGNERTRLYNISGAVGGLTTNGGATQAAPQIVGTVPVNQVFNLAYRSSVNDFRAANNGTLSSLDSSGTIALEPNTITIGVAASAAAQMFGQIDRLAIFAEAKADSFLQAITL